MQHIRRILDINQINSDIPISKLSYTWSSPFNISKTMNENLLHTLLFDNPLSMGKYCEFMKGRHMNKKFNIAPCRNY